MNLEFWLISFRSFTDCSSVYVFYFNHEQPLSRDILLLAFVDKTNDSILSNYQHLL